MPGQLLELNPPIVEHIEVGIFVVNSAFEVQLWNQFMVRHSGKTAEEVLSHNLFDLFPELPQKWLEKKLRSVFLLKHFSFVSWEQRPYLFKFPHNRPITGGVDFMQQSCTFMPLRGEQGQIENICALLYDMTDVAIYQRQLQQALHQLEETNNRDALTGVFNRRYTMQRLLNEAERAQRYHSPLSVLMFDLDHFKQINDTLGHLAGDEVLRVCSRHVVQLLRESDILGRFGGEEFLIILPQTDLDGVKLLGDRLRHAIEQLDVLIEDKTIQITASFGGACLMEGMQDIEDLIQVADLALYQSKHAGRNRVTVC
ncbi:diguanylate cyclase (GGDEF)-like protein [Chitinivorax tropicus]|uniref:diguanylate cyclase n=1 Tax=Chitinivorax tropicus TaxID=714531 RepID=A0A840MG77_9PROT|nr:diguanylate cyclase [Chitinivorax tropicus]MBB5017658.1 diguanylate cyclase (GGDEF)-like protein [Chitinivorax tropicus]